MISRPQIEIPPVPDDYKWGKKIWRCGHIDLWDVFEHLNKAHFDGFLITPIVTWNDRLRSSAGRFIPGSRNPFSDRLPKIEVASYLSDYENMVDHVFDTVGHEMIHYWLWVRERPYGHTPEFKAKMRQMGVSRYNPVPHPNPYKFAYACPSCSKEFYSRRRLGRLACMACCKKHNGGRFHEQFLLYFSRDLSTSEGLELFYKRLRTHV